MKNELKSLGEEECNLAKKLELRKKQCHNLITSIKQMKNTLELGMLLFCSKSFKKFIVYNSGRHPDQNLCTLKCKKINLCTPRSYFDKRL